MATKKIIVVPCIVIIWLNRSAEMTLAPGHMS